MTPDPKDLVDLMRRAAEAEILPRFGCLGEAEVRAKVDASLVTDADEGAERFLFRELERELPGALMIGEEAVAVDPARLLALSEADMAIVIDPVDGTANFVAGLPAFNVVVAVTRKAETVIGIIYDPITGMYAVAERGGGAYLVGPTGDRKRMHVAIPRPLDQMSGFVETGDLPADERRRLLSNLSETREFTSLRCASHEYRALASGHADFALYHRTKPWDHLAGVLIATEAGAYSATLAGIPYSASMPAGALLTAASEEGWRSLMEAAAAQ